MVSAAWHPQGRRRCQDRLYNSAALQAYDTVCIAEGIFSAACIGDNAVALCGKTIVPAQLARLQASTVETFVVCLDAEAKGDMIVLADALVARGKRVVVRQYRQGDPASCKHWVDSDYTFSLRVSLQLQA
jgi:hypothetical protein